jgi:hypothetical protein
VWTAETAQQKGITVHPAKPAPVSAGSPATGIQTAPRPLVTPLVSRPTKAQPAGVWGHIKRVLTPIASLRLTVWLFALAILLVFFGTLAQVDEGLFTVLHKYFRAWLAWIPVQALVRFGQVFFGVSKTTQVPWVFPFPGGWLLGALLLVNLLAAHAVRFKLSWKRSGILILHAGLVILMVSELITGLFAVESRMAIEANHSKNYVEDHQEVELVFVTPADPQTDDVVAIPGSLLRKGGVIRNDDLPVDVEVVRYMANSRLMLQADPGSSNPATAGDGVRWVAEERREVSGAQAGQDSDMPSVYVTFKKKGTEEVLGTYLATTWLSNYWATQLPERPQQVSVDGKTYSVSLRAKRTYTPYSIKLLEFRHDKYMGTDIPKNFSSDIQLVDTSRNEDRTVRVSMNNPLRYQGETFYQSGVLGKDEGTILQVVRNPGWEMPYVACTMVALGMLIHFGLHLIGFLRLRFAK